MSMIKLEERLRQAVQSYWSIRQEQQDKQAAKGQRDAGSRGAVTGGGHMCNIEALFIDIMLNAGLACTDIRTRTSVELPGYYRPEKQWDLLVISNKQLVTAIEFKSQVAPSFGNNFNNRIEEAIGSATDIWTAFREGRFGSGPRPFLGYFFLLEDCPAVHKPTRSAEPYFTVDPIFKNSSYSKRYEIFCQRLVLERLFDAACLTLSTKETPTTISHPAEDLTFRRFIAALEGHIHTFIRSQ